MAKRKCVTKGCTNSVSGKDTWRCVEHELRYYMPAFSASCPKGLKDYERSDSDC